MTTNSPITTAKHFINHLIEGDLSTNKFAKRHWSGQPGLASQQLAGAPDIAKIRTRFPPEPNGYLHFGHAKSIYLNFGLAAQYDGACHLRFDDTNPEKEAQEYVDSITNITHWLGFSWSNFGDENLYFASDYFEFMIQCAEHLIKAGHAYVDSQDADTIRINRGTLTDSGKNSPYRDRHADENMTLFRQMQAGKFEDGTHVLRAKIDMSAPNINMRDPILYRIRHVEHHRTKNRWCVYPMYTYAHPIEDALENITHSICTLEFEDQRPFYDWLLERLEEEQIFQSPLPKQIEFSRLNLSFTVLSKRKLAQLVEEGHVDGWDDPRLPTLVGARRRGYTPEGLRHFIQQIGISKSDSVIDFGLLEESMREHLNVAAERRIAVLDPIKLVITNYPNNQTEVCHAPNHPQQPERGKREIPFSRELWIDRNDFMEHPVKGYRRLKPDGTVRLRYAYVVHCTGYEKNTDGQIETVYCEYLPETKSGTPGADQVKVKGNLHWVSTEHAFSATVRLYDRLFLCSIPGNNKSNFLEDINPDSKRIIQAQLEPSLQDAQPESCYQFERHGYFVADRVDSSLGAPVFNLTTTLRDSWNQS